ncbi:MAG: S8 family serine peptidase, partial [Candidatus Sericytochromatia bacterium]
MRKLTSISLVLSLVGTLLATGCHQASPTGVRFEGLPEAGPARLAPPPVRGGMAPYVPGYETTNRMAAGPDEPLPPGAGPDEADFRAGAPALVQDQLIVAVRPGARAVLSADGPQAMREIAMDRRYQIVKIPPGMTRDQAIDRLRRQPGVEMVAPNRVYQPTLTPNDARFDDQWGLSKR